MSIRLGTLGSLISFGGGKALRMTGGRLHYWSFMGSTLPAGAALARASTGWYFNSGLSLTSADTDVARFAYDRNGAGFLGLLVEPAATNGIRNGSAGGASAGTPGTAPTNWVVSSTADSVTRTIVGTGTEDGIPYIDIQYAGTPSASGTKGIRFEAATQIAASIGQAWTGSVFVRVVGGAMTNVTLDHRINERDSGGAALSSTIAAVSPTGAALRTQRVDVLRTLSTVGVAFVTSQLTLNYTSGQQVGGAAAGVTLRIGLPQLVQVAAASTSIVTTSAAVTRAADVLTLTVADGTYAINLARVSGTTNLLGQVVTGGAYTVPTDVSPLRTITARRTA